MSAAVTTEVGENGTVKWPDSRDQNNRRSACGM